MLRDNAPPSAKIAAAARPSGVSRRRFAGGMAALAGLVPLGLATSRAIFADEPAPAATKTYPLFEEAVSRVLPEEGFQSRIALGDAVIRLMSYGVVDAGQMFALYGTSGGLPEALAGVLAEPLYEPIRLTMDNSRHYVNLLWPVGLATYMGGNEESPLNGDNLYRFASTGGWTLGQAENGGGYFNSYPIVDLTPDQESLVLRMAKATYRPCCNNSTFFQDCNHGSALLGVLQLGAAQGLSEPELCREALAFNSFWFPQNYIRTALYFKIFEQTEWPDVDPKVVLAFRYSAGGPWQENVARPLAGIRGLIPEEPGEGAFCAL